MRNALVILAVLLLAMTANANTFLQTTQGGVSLNAAAATGRGTCFTISGNGPDKFPNLYTFTVTTTGSPTGYTVLLEGSQVGNGSDAATLGTITQATAQTIYVSGVSPANVCANLTVLSGGTSPKVTATIIPYVSANIAYPGQPLSTATITGGTINGTVIGGTTAAAITGTTITGTSLASSTGGLLWSSAAPTISSGFGTGATIAANNGTAAFTIGVGTTSATTGVIGLPTATTGWSCLCQDITTFSTTVFLCRQTASSTASATIGGFTSAAVAQAWTNADVLRVSCFAY